LKLLLNDEPDEAEELTELESAIEHELRRGISLEEQGFAQLTVDSLAFCDNRDDLLKARGGSL
jgi:hypothetical protein